MSIWKYLLAGGVGFVVAKLFEEDKKPKYADGGYIKNIKKLYEEDGSDVYGGDFGEQGGLNWRINKEEDYLYLMGIGRNNKGSNEGNSKGEGSRAIAYLFFLYPKLNVIYFEIEGEEGSWQFYKKIGAEEEGGGEITEDTYNAQIERKSFRKYFENKDISFSFKNGGNVLLAPNGKPSKLTPEQYKLVRSQAFKNWFGDWENDRENSGKVVDENGEPLPVYHGTTKEFTIFNKKELGTGTKATLGYLGFFFTDDKSLAIDFTRKKWISPKSKLKEGSKFIDAFLNIRNPKYMTIDEYIIVDNNNRDSESIIKYQKKLVRQGFDGVIVEKAQMYWQSKMREFDGKQYVAFEPNQIKLADGTNTTFDSNNPDIRYAGGGELPKTSKDENGNWSGEYLGHKFTLYNLSEGWLFAIYFYSAIMDNQEIYQSTEDYIPLRTKKDALNSIIEKIIEINSDNEDFNKKRQSNNPDIRFDGGGKVKKVKFNIDEDEDGDRTEISIKGIGQVILVVTYPEYEFLEDIGKDGFEELGIEEGDMIGKIEHIRIEDKYKGQGYAKLLMNKAIEVAKEKGLMPLYLNASPMGSDGLDVNDLTGFYESFGFYVFLEQGNNNLMILS